MKKVFLLLLMMAQAGCGDAEQEATELVAAVPEVTEDCVMVLYEDPENCILKFQDSPKKSQWPK